MGGGGRDAPFLAPHPAKISLHPCGAVEDGAGMHRARIRGDPRGFYTVSDLPKSHPRRSHTRPEFVSNREEHKNTH